RTVAGVAGVAPRGVVLLIAEQVSQFAIEGAFNECLAKVFEEVFNLSGCLAAGEQLIDKLRIEFGCLLFWLNGHGSESFLKYGCLLHFVRLHKLSDTLDIKGLSRTPAYAAIMKRFDTNLTSHRISALPTPSICPFLTICIAS